MGMVEKGDTWQEEGEVARQYIRNMYGWNVMQPSAISQDMWDETYRVSW